MTGSVTNACYRVGYRIAYPWAVRWWKIRRRGGISVAVWVGDRVLLVQHSYKVGLRIPSGAIEAGEQHASTAARELREETGIRVDPKELHLVMTIPSRYGQRHIYEARLDHEPKLKVDNREITYAGFHPPHEVTEWNTAVRNYLISEPL